MPRPWIFRGLSYFQMSSPVSGRSAVIDAFRLGEAGEEGVENYMMPPTLSGVTSKR